MLYEITGKYQLVCTNVFKQCI